MRYAVFQFNIVPSGWLVIYIILGTFCNHYFLQMLAMIGRGQYDAAYDVGQFCILYFQKEVVFAFLFFINLLILIK